MPQQLTSHYDFHDFPHDLEKDNDNYFDELLQYFSLNELLEYFCLDNHQHLDDYSRNMNKGIYTQNYLSDYSTGTHVHENLFSTSTHYHPSRLTENELLNKIYNPFDLITSTIRPIVMPEHFNKSSPNTHQFVPTPCPKPHWVQKGTQGTEWYKRYLSPFNRESQSNSPPHKSKKFYTDIPLQVSPFQLLRN